MAVGRISGPLLKSNLVRSTLPVGERDLAFETDLLYIDINNSRIGVKTSAPQHELDVLGTTRTTDLEVTNQLDIGNLHVTGNTISSDLNTISFQPSGGDPTVYFSRLQIDDFDIQNNVISTTVSNSNIELRPNGTGTVDVFSDENIYGDLTVTGNIDVTGDVTIGGNITIGDANTDTIVVNARIASDLIPEVDNTYDLGSSSFRWRNFYAVNISGTNLTLDTLSVGDMFMYDNVITTTSGQDLIIDPSGAGDVKIGNFDIVGNTITNRVNNAVSIIAQSGTGYFKINGTNAFLPPVGTVAQRPTAYAVVGMTRYNTETKILEVWDGAIWASPAGSSGAVSEAQANDIAAALALTLG